MFCSNEYDIIHYIGDAEFNVKQPDNSKLHFADSGLSANEIQRLSFSQRPIIFANGCSTSRTLTNLYIGKTSSLATAFLKAGALAFIGTMWPIEDKMAAEFASDFYMNVIEYSIGESLKKTRLNMKLKKNEHDAWLPYSFFGDPLRRIRKN